MSYSTKTPPASKLLPYFLFRVASEPFALIEEFPFSKNRVNRTTYYRLEANISALKQSLLDDLFKFNQACSEKTIQNIVQNNRRAIHNNKTLKQAQIDQLRAVITDELSCRLAGYLQAREELEVFRIHANEEMLIEIQASKHVLKRYVSIDSLKKGLALSSLDFYSATKRYWEKGESNSKIVNEEIGLIKYLTRLTTKTSPFSTFTTVGVSKFDETGSENRQSRRSNVRLNNKLLAHILESLKFNQETFPNLTISVNPTTRVEGEQIKFFTNINNTECIQTLVASELVLRVISMMSSVEAPTSLNELTDELAEECEDSPPNLLSYLKKLVDIGLLEFSMPVSGLDPNWDVSLLAALSRIDKKGKFTESIQPALAKLSQLKEAFAHQNDLERISTIASSTAIIASIAQLVADSHYNKAEETTTDFFSRKFNPSFSIKPEQIFYEDVSSLQGQYFSSQLAEIAVKKLSQLIHALSDFQPGYFDRRKLKEYFKLKYGRTANVDVLDLYEDYHREVALVSESEPQYPKALKELREEFDEKYRRLNEAIKTILTRKTDVDGIKLSVQDLSELVTSSKVTGRSGSPNSWGFFAQATSTQSVTAPIVVNGIFPGYGKMMGRFLHLFDNQITDSIRQHNISIFPEDCLLIEDCDSTHFLANVHPALMPYEISIPGSTHNLGTNQHKPVSDFEVLYLQESDELTLRHKQSGLKASIFDLGFQNPLTRSRLYQLLQLFSNSDLTGIAFLLKAINTWCHDTNLAALDNAIAVLPRVTFDDQMIIQRKTWLVPKHKLAAITDEMNEWDFYVAMNKWREELGIPILTFVSLSDDGLALNRGNKGNRNDDYKPQFIDFENPLLLKLLAKLMKRANSEVRLQEMLPGPDEMILKNGKKFVSEYLIQWYES